MRGETRQGATQGIKVAAVRLEVHPDHELPVGTWNPGSYPHAPAPFLLPSPHLGHLWLPRVLRPEASGTEPKEEWRSRKA